MKIWATTATMVHLCSICLTTQEVGLASAMGVVLGNIIPILTGWIVSMKKALPFQPSFTDLTSNILHGMMSHKSKYQPEHNLCKITVNQKAVFSPFPNHLFQKVGQSNQNHLEEPNHLQLMPFLEQEYCVMKSMFPTEPVHSSV